MSVLELKKWRCQLCLLIFITWLLLGTGASCIYPLLGAKLNGWHFLATEVDELSVSFAEKNVQGNGLESKIKGIST